MAIESLVALGLAVAYLGAIAWYSTRHRAEDLNDSHGRKNHCAGK